MNPTNEFHRRTPGYSIQNGDRIDLDMNAFHRERYADKSIHRIVITEELMVDFDLFAFERMPLVWVGNEHGQFADIGWLTAFSFDHSSQSVKDDSQLFHRASVLGRGTVSCAAGQEKHVSCTNSTGVVRAGRINIFEVNAPLFHGNYLMKDGVVRIDYANGQNRVEKLTTGSLADSEIGCNQAIGCYQRHQSGYARLDKDS